MFSRTIAVVVVVVALGGAASGLSAQALPADAGAPAVIPPKPVEKYDLFKMAEWDFLYGNEKDREEGIGYMQEMCREKLDPFQAPYRHEQWRDWACGEMYRASQVLFARKEYELCDKIGLYGSIIGSTQLPWLEKFQELRVQAKLKAGKADEALPLAKSYYNICSMAKTGAAIDLISTCLMESQTIPDPAGAVRKYRMQQAKGATPPATSEGATPERAKSVLDDVKVEAGEYEKTAKQLEAKEQTYLCLLDQGNLLLLADQPAAAKALLKKAYAVASEERLSEASESVARAMRAEDGTVGRANAWILTLRSQADEK